MLDKLIGKIPESYKIGGMGLIMALIGGLGFILVITNLSETDTFRSIYFGILSFGLIIFGVGLDRQD